MSNLLEDNLNLILKDNEDLKRHSDILKSQTDIFSALIHHRNLMGDFIKDLSLPSDLSNQYCRSLENSIQIFDSASFKFNQLISEKIYHNK